MGCHVFSSVVPFFWGFLVFVLVFFGGSVDTGGDLCGTICCSSSIQHETNIDTICGTAFGLSLTGGILLQIWLATCKWACQRLRCRLSLVGGSNAVHRERA